MSESELTFNDYVQMTIDAGIESFTLNFYPIIDMDAGFPIAYRTKTTINSIKLGTMQESDYTYVSDVRQCGAELFKRNIQHTITALNKFIEKGRNVQYLTVRCPSELVEATEVYDIGASVLKRNPSVDPSKICIEFPASLLDRDTERARTAILDLKMLHFRTAVLDCGSETFPISKLATIPVDIAFLTPETTAYALNRDKPQLISSLISYLRSMNVSTVAVGEEQERKAMRRAECTGFLLKDCQPLDLDQALAQKEEE